PDGWPGRAWETNVPLAADDVTQPSAVRSAYAARTVFRFTVSCLASVLVPGSLAPGRRRPRAMSAVIARAICRKTGYSASRSRLNASSHPATPPVLPPLDHPGSPVRRILLVQLLIRSRNASAVCMLVPARFCGLRTAAAAAADEGSAA